eukprot:5811900-Pyramimonas_sp.AAC.1
MPATNLVRPQALGVARNNNYPRKELAPAGRAEPGRANYAGWFAQQKMEAMLQKLSKGTRAGYEGGWRLW